MSGTLSRVVIHPIRNVRTCGFTLPIRSTMSGAKSRKSNSPLSATMSFRRRSNRLAAFCTFASASALSLHSSVNTGFK